MEMEDQRTSILTLKELSLYIRIPESSVYKLVREGRIPGQKIGKTWRFHTKAIDNWLCGDYTSSPTKP